MKDYDNYINRQAEILQEFDNFADQFEARAAESFKNPQDNDKKYDLLKESIPAGNLDRGVTRDNSRETE